MDHEVRQPGDWVARRPGLEPTGWHFQYQNGHYPDIDDTAMVLLALQRSALAGDAEPKAAMERAVSWLLAMQNRDGGWAAFDVDIDNQVLTKVPFADHNAMLDPSCADITARILELLGNRGERAEHPAIARALEYLWSTQEPEGCWYGRWGVNYIYGTWQVLLGLRSIDFPLDHPRVRRAADWLESVQQNSGGWGESCASYEDPALKAIGEPTASQTAWAVLGLIAAGRERSLAVRRGIEYLLDTQSPDGTWQETEFTGTGFPKVFYLRYHFYRIYFPLMALARYRAALGLPATSHAHLNGNTHHVNTGPVASRIPAQPSPSDH
jgi:squalene-hopene/tetraprenyl-beta-curcumene cyclase